MKLADVAAATITWVRSPADCDMLLRSIGSLAASGLSVALGDRGSSPRFAALASEIPGVTVVNAGPGLVAQVKASVALAAKRDTPFILYTEPDKEAFFAQHLRRFVRAAPDDADLGVVIAGRSDASLRTFPPVQRFTEGTANEQCGRVLGVDGDYMYGPFLMSRALLPSMTNLAADLGWGWRPAIFVAARRLGLRIVHVVGEYDCPLEQRVEDDHERRHRHGQLEQNLAGLIA